MTDRPTDVCHPRPRPSVAAAESQLTADEVQKMVSEWLQELSGQLKPLIAQLLGQCNDVLSLSTESGSERNHEA